MKMSYINWKAVLFASGSAVLCGVAYSVIKKTDIFKYLENRCDPGINEVLIYGGDDEDILVKQAGLDNLKCIYYIILHANSSVDVCMPSLNSDTITNCLKNVNQKDKVKIRVLVHKAHYFDQVLLLAEHGIEVKVVLDEKLRHEFILVDADESPGDSVALIGSLDFEINRVNCNRDSTLLISDVLVVNALKREFDRIWASLDCNVEDVVEIII